VKALLLTEFEMHRHKLIDASSSVETTVSDEIDG